MAGAIKRTRGKGRLERFIVVARERGISPRICPRLYPWPRNDPIRGMELFECKIRAESALIVFARIVVPFSSYIRFHDMQNKGSHDQRNAVTSGERDV